VPGDAPRNRFFLPGTRRSARSPFHRCDLALIWANLLIEAPQITTAIRSVTIRSVLLLLRSAPRAATSIHLRSRPLLMHAYASLSGASTCKSWVGSREGAIRRLSLRRTVVMHDAADEFGETFHAPR
jgi:hypothetical protein